MNYETELQEASKFFAQCLDIFGKKANDYAKDSNPFSNFEKIATMVDIPVEKAFLVFMAVKIARIVELLGKKAKNESMEDSLKDLANYTCLMYIYQRSKK